MVLDVLLKSKVIGRIKNCTEFGRWFYDFALLIDVNKSVFVVH